MHSSSSSSGPSPLVQGSAALAYASASLLIMFVNKIVLSSYNFPSSAFLAVCQSVASIFLLYFAKMFGVIQFQSMSRNVFSAVFPLPLIFMLNTLSGLGGTQSLNIPMFTVLRRFSILFTMVLEGIILGTTASVPVQFSVFLMIIGALIAALDDLTFNMMGYTLILANNIFTALNGVVLKKKLNSKELGTWGLMFYNNLFSLPFNIILLYYNDPLIAEKVTTFPIWDDYGFRGCFFLATIMGFVLNFSIFWCTQVNSPLTTTVIGCLKNVLSTYLAMLFLPGYEFAWLNFFGINVSVFGSVLYSYVKYGEQQKSRPPQKLSTGDGKDTLPR
eukprot:Nk52_evm50s2391 gene=Nk52_evmTU50s2391